MSDPQTLAAIDAALSNDWQTALVLNTKILEENPSDLDCMNRLGKAYLELGNNKKAATIFKEVLKLNKYDPIATKNLLRANETAGSKPAKSTNGHAPTVPSGVKFSNISFLEEPGKTKMVTLVNVAPAKVLLCLRCADGVLLTVKRHSMLVENKDGTYLGALPDDLGHRLMVLVQGGNDYDAFIKSVSKSAVTLFIREKKRSKRFKNTPSFPSGNSEYLSFVRDEGHEEVEVKATEDDSGDEGDESDFKKNLHQDEVQEEN